MGMENTSASYESARRFAANVDVARLLEGVTPLRSSVENFVGGIPEGKRSHEVVFAHTDINGGPAASIFTVDGTYGKVDESHTSNFAVRIHVAEGKMPLVAGAYWLTEFSATVASVHDPASGATAYELAYKTNGIDLQYAELEIALATSFRTTHINGGEEVTVESGSLAIVQSADNPRIYNGDTTEATFAMVTAIVAHAW